MSNLLNIFIILVIIGFLIGFLVYVYYYSTSIWYFVGVLCITIIFVLIPSIVPIYWYIFGSKIAQNPYDLSQRGGKRKCIKN